MGELKQFFPQPAGNENGADLSLQTDLRPASPTASTVRCSTSLTRIPVAQMDSMSRA